MANKVEEIDLETAQKIIEAAERKKLEAFWADIKAVEQKHGYVLSPYVELGAKKA